MINVYLNKYLAVKWTKPVFSIHTDFNWLVGKWSKPCSLKLPNKRDLLRYTYMLKTKMGHFTLKFTLLRNFHPLYYINIFIPQSCKMIWPWFSWKFLAQNPPCWQIIYTSCLSGLKIVILNLVILWLSVICFSIKVNLSQSVIKIRIQQGIVSWTSLNVGFKEQI